MGHRRFDDARLVVASHNEGKVREIRDLLLPLGIETTSARELDLEEPEETGATFRENAELKALTAATASGSPALADDSGLSVEALGGEPGIFSARWAGPNKDFSIAMQKIEDALLEKGATAPEQRVAHFVCALSLAWPDGHRETFEGRVQGSLVWPPRGGQGFGYDPIFLPTGLEQTFGEIEPAAKHAISHRAEAFRLLMDVCF